MFPHGLCPLAVIGIVAFQHVGKEKKLEYEEKDKQLHQDEYPQIPSHGHAAEAVAVKTVHAPRKGFHMSECIHADAILETQILWIKNQDGFVMETIQGNIKFHTSTSMTVPSR